MADSIIHSIGLCAGVGMLDLGLSAGLEHLGIGHRTIAYCEREAYAASQLLALMESECLDAAPIWPDLTTFPASEFRGVVDCVTAGFPCQPHSVAGKREGTDDARWIWPAIVGIIRDSGAWLVVLENVRGLLSSGGMAPVLADLAGIGFAAEWTVLGAGEVGASHRRERVFIVGVAHGNGWRLRINGGGGLLDGQWPAQPDNTDRFDSQPDNADQRQRERGESCASRRGEPDGRCVELADAARHGGNRPYGQSGRGRGVCGDGGEVADAECGTVRRDSGATPCAETGDEGRTPEQCDGAQCVRGSVADAASRERFAGPGYGQRPSGATRSQGEGLANPSSGLIPEPWRGAQGRDGAGSAVAVLEDSDARIGRSVCEPGPAGRRAFAGDAGERMADASGDGLGGCWRPAAIEPSQRDDRSLFAPGPSDPRWPGIIERWPWLAPALKPGVRGMVDATSLVVDESRRDQLRAIGNGCVPIQAAAAIVALVRRLMQ